MERIMKKIMMLFTCIAATCWDCGAMNIETIRNIPDEAKFSGFQLRGGMSVKEFYKRALSGKISGEVSLNFITYDKNNDTNVVEKQSESFSFAAGIVFQRYCNNPNPMTLEDMLRFACSFVPLIYWELADYEIFDQVATSECTCRNSHANGNGKTTFISIPSFSYPLQKNYQFWNSRDPYLLEFSVRERVS
jgi:hypothetical protein